MTVTSELHTGRENKETENRREGCIQWRLRERRWFVLTRPRCDINGESVTEVTVTSKRHKQKYRDRELNIVIDAIIDAIGIERKVGFTEKTAARHRWGG